VPGTGVAPHAIVIGAGFCGLAAAYELLKRGVRVTILEREPEIGGLASSFVVNGTRLERFYHHWFTSDQYIMDLVRELGVSDKVINRSTRTGLYYANSAFRLSSPIDLLRLDPLSPLDRARLGLLALRTRCIRNWMALESLSAATWLRQMAGQKVYEVIWEPLLRAKFGIYAEEISAVWFWNKLKLRGGSRSRNGAEQLAYYRGGFAALADRLAEDIHRRGGRIHTRTPVTRLAVSHGTCVGVFAGNEQLQADVVISTTALPIIAELVEPHVPSHYVLSLRRIKYLANLCLVLELDRSLSETYWLNVTDPTFPFVGVIEHTNFEPPQTYGGRHIVYLSKYLADSDTFFGLEDEKVLNYALPHLRRMFPTFAREWILDYHVWRARYSQPVVECNYSQMIPCSVSPLSSFYLATMAQIYPEDRGTNYAVREGKRIAALVNEHLRHTHSARPPGNDEVDMRRATH